MSSNARPTRDTPEAALAEALKIVNHSTGWNIRCACDRDAAAILAALSPDWCGHGADHRLGVELVARQRAEIARLRKIEAAARLPRNTKIVNLPGYEGVWVAIPEADFDALRAVLDPPEVRPPETNSTVPEP